MTPMARFCAIGIAALCAACGTEKTTHDVPSAPEGQAEPVPAAASAAMEVEIHEVANDPDIHGAMDSTPSPDGSVIYFIATTADASEEGRVAGVFEVAADGGEIKALAIGAGLVAPTGIAISRDGRELYVSDMVADNGEGALLRASLSAAADHLEFVPIASTVGYLPRAVSVGAVEGQDWVCFTGRDPERGAAGAYCLKDDVLSEVGGGAALVEPAGISVARDGAVYVVDALSSDGTASLLKLQGDAGKKVVGGLGVGFPAGLTLDLAESKALISGLDSETKRDIVYLVDLDSGALSQMSDTVDAFFEGAGLHRAHNKNVFSWADAEANETGTVYVLTL